MKMRATDTSRLKERTLQDECGASSCSAVAQKKAKAKPKPRVRQRLRVGRGQRRRRARGQTMCTSITEMSATENDGVGGGRRRRCSDQLGEHSEAVSPGGV